MALSKREVLRAQVVLFPVAAAFCIREVDDRDEAARYADEFNRMEAKEDTGFIAIVDFHNLCAAKS